MKKFKELELKENSLRSELLRCKVSKNAIPHIINMTDLNKVPANTDELDQFIKNEWKDFIFD